MRDFDPKKTVSKGIKNIDVKDVGWVVKNSKAIIDKVNKAKSIAKFFARIKIALEMLSDYFNGRYKKVPWRVIAALTFAMIYFFSPVDAIPDFIPGIGYVDDLGVISFVFGAVNSEIDKYLRWKKRRGKKVYW